MTGLRRRAQPASNTLYLVRVEVSKVEVRDVKTKLLCKSFSNGSMYAGGLARIAASRLHKFEIARSFVGLLPHNVPHGMALTRIKVAIESGHDICFVDRIEELLYDWLSTKRGIFAGRAILYAYKGGFERVHRRNSVPIAND